MHQQVSLFNASPPEFEEAWLAWSSWMTTSGRVNHASSLVVYQHMWTALATWCTAQGVALDALTPQRLDDYLASRSGEGQLSPRYAWRLLRLVERIQAHRSRFKQVLLNRAAATLMERRPEIRYANAQESDEHPDYLGSADERSLWVALLSDRWRPIAKAEWQGLRNRASVAVQLGAGLTPIEIRNLTLANLLASGGSTRGSGRIRFIEVSSPEGSHRPIVPLQLWAARILSRWLALRADLGVPGDRVFPSTRSSGKPWGKVAQYEAVRKVFEAAGIDATDGGSYRLRHTYALRQLRRGVPPEQLAQWLGVSDPGVMARYARLTSIGTDR